MAASRTAQRAQVKDALEAARMRLGDTYYVVSQKWWASWRQYVGYDQGLEGSLEQLSVSGASTLHKKTLRCRLPRSLKLSSKAKP